MLRTKILAGPISNLTDARYFAAREAEWLLFDFDPTSESFIEPRAVSAIREWVDGVKMVGAFQLEEAYEIREAAERLQLDVVLLGMATPVETVIDLQLAVPVLKEIVVERTTTPADLTSLLETWTPFVQFFVLNFTKNGITWTMLNEDYPLSVGFLKKCCSTFSIVLSIDLQPEMLNNMLNVLHLYGLHVTGSVEEIIGYKSFDEWDAILDVLEV